jgi:hypothetical protein
MLFRGASVLVPPLIASMSVGAAVDWAQPPPFPPQASAAARPTDPGNLLRDFQTYYIRSQTPFFRPELLLKLARTGPISSRGISAPSRKSGKQKLSSKWIFHHCHGSGSSR